MRKQIGILAVTLALILALGALAAPAQADDFYREKSEVDSMMTKLGRGVANVLTGWLEIPHQIGTSIRETDPVSGTFIGLFRGAAWTVARTATGVFEVVTFPFPLPESYKPIIQPPYIVKAMWGEPMPIISDRNNNAWEGMETPGTPPYR
ncbi:exosortase system-associated protein, TIGR04073 family [bacterium]|nr:exosortase system-associated protein, TIGR04073 family [bacterium]